METIAAIDRFVAAGLERHFCHSAALAAGRTEHFALATATAAAETTTTTTTTGTATTATASGFTRSAAIGATVGLVGKALHREELLFSGGKRERARTIDAVQGFILVHI